MRRIGYHVRGTTLNTHDAAIVVGDEDPRETFVESVVQTISTDVMVTVGEVTMHLAAWQDPDHWEDDWREIGVEDVDALLAGAVTADA